MRKDYITLIVLVIVCLITVIFFIHIATPYTHSGIYLMDPDESVSNEETPSLVYSKDYFLKHFSEQATGMGITFGLKFKQGISSYGSNDGWCSTKVGDTTPFGRTHSIVSIDGQVFTHATGSSMGMYYNHTEDRYIQPLNYKNCRYISIIEFSDEGLIYGKNYSASDINANDALFGKFLKVKKQEIFEKIRIINPS